MSARRSALAVVCLAVIASALALAFGGWVGDTIRARHATDTTSTSTTVYQPGTTAAPVPVMPAQGTDCMPLVLADGVDYSHLTDAGWFGVPTDGMEALYAPGCSVLTGADGASFAVSCY